ncbi:hydroxymethylglutaryl-CoA lyase [Microtetraspora sp. AC03309]|uniref:hydroxymethylglutaryl-CoA lyase n=1 Tax=Microtetraspora sp. AC03309 TaxID=2779376 RepID=UPI001E5CDC37|nr:hydroxymethylglutaryl-CoA lyase [Microtetraspora sp. AC03309]MCC5578129.1 hydroxymethylglutaryl-CoA lyase [Microtetraspora sp. AC03309]
MTSGTPTHPFAAAVPGVHVEIVEVSPRDGLQNEPVTVGTEHKKRLVEDLVAAGVRRIEVTSFVRPDRVPQMADADALMASLESRPGVTFVGLVLNRRGAERAIRAGIHELNYVVPATDAFGTRNQGVTTDEALKQLEDIGVLAERAGIPLSATVAVAFGCPYQGEVPTERVVEVARLALGTSSVRELALADTIGSGVPHEVFERFTAVREISDVRLRAHFHDTRRTAIANAQAAIAAGVTALDASAAGLGGCPFAPGAAGNVATEDLAWALRRGGYDTGLDISAIVAAGAQACEHLGTTPRSGVANAGVFP